METEGRNENSKNLQKKSTREILRLINDEDRRVADAVRNEIPRIESVIREFVTTFKNGGTIYYVGTGTSGRLGVLDASEIPPTFGVPEGRVVGLIAGGVEALTSAREGREDDRVAGERLAKEKDITDGDLIIGISASGTTPFVLGCLEAANNNGAATASITNNLCQPIEKYSDTSVVVETGPEVIAGSTRMKAGTAQKMVLNMISTVSMIRLGKVYDNLMVDVVASNQKLKKRAKRILNELTSAEEAKIEEVLETSDYEVKPAILAVKGQLSVKEARKLLQSHDGYLDSALKDLRAEA
ncbi:N-acetylmuramic acid 6-phosphate etherase [Candidatus Bipolaricaulota bacterium]|nr:N-acetylmuramic acid 6-phosphate etherase [Candidatus Bipolaricaulota bacterium]